MCGRVDYPDTKVIVSKTGLKFNGDPLAKNINAAPTLPVPVVDSSKPDELQYKKWWLIPWYSKTGKPEQNSTFNARFDKLLVSPLWKQLIEKKQFCVVITTGYYEWEVLEPENKKSPKQPWLIRAKGEDFTYLAGLWDDWTNKGTGEVISSCTVITHDAVESMGKIHNRMPTFLTKDNIPLWLDPEVPFSEKIKLIEPASEGFLEAIKINKVGDIDEYNSVLFQKDMLKGD